LVLGSDESEALNERGSLGLLLLYLVSWRGLFEILIRKLDCVVEVAEKFIADELGLQVLLDGVFGEVSFVHGSFFRKFYGVIQKFLTDQLRIL